MAGGNLPGPPSQGAALSTRGGLTESQRGMLLSKMSDASVAMMLGRGEAWVKRQRSVLADLPVALTVQDRAATAAKPWRPDDDPFEPLKPVEVAPPGQTGREASIAAVRATPPSPAPRPSAGAFPVRAAPPPAWAQRAAAPERGYEPPAVIPADPAVLSEKSYERNFVRSKRALRISWQNIALMLGKCELQLRGEYGGTL